MAKTDRQAYDLVKSALPGLSEPEAQYLLAVSRGEGFYGDGWAEGRGAGSHNWGAVQAGKSWIDSGKPTFTTTDHHSNGSPYEGRFRVYDSDEAGARDMSTILLKPNVRAALASGNGTEAVKAQKANGYFELALPAYWTAVTRNYAALVKNAGITGALQFPPLVRAPLPPSSGGDSSSAQPDTSSPAPFVPKNFVELPKLMLGCYGEPVRVLCVLLDVPLRPQFDDAMRGVVIAFQAHHGLVTDGVVGSRTWKILLDSVKP